MLDLDLCSSGVAMLWWGFSLLLGLALVLGGWLSGALQSTAHLP